MIQDPQCNDCKHQHEPDGRRGIFCDAFPDGVPLDIAFNIHDHTGPYPGDMGIRFEPKDEGDG